MSQFFANHRLTKAWLDSMGIVNYLIKDDLTVDVDGMVYLGAAGLKYLPVQFRIVTGAFNCRSNSLTSLCGCPTSVGGSCFLSANPLVSLDYLPERIGMMLYLFDVPLKSAPLSLLTRQLAGIVGLPRDVQAIFDKHFESKDIFAYQQDLIDYGLEEYAQL